MASWMAERLGLGISALKNANNQVTSPALKSTHWNVLGYPPRVVFTMSAVNATNTTAHPARITAQRPRPIFIGSPRYSRHNTASPTAIIELATTTGVITGPTHGTGNRN